MSDFGKPEFAVVDRILRHAHGPLAGRTAIEDADGSVTYRTLAERVGHLRDILPDSEPGPLVVAVHGVVDRDFLFLLLAIWSRGHVVLPIDQGLPIERKSAILGHDWIGLLVDLAATPLETGLAVPVWRLGDASGPLAAPRARRLTDKAGAAYVTFSSGTTGKPKALLGRADSLSHFIDWQGQEFAFTMEDRVPVLTSPSFDPYMREVLTALSAGGTLVLTDPGLRGEPDALMRVLHDARITRLHAVPTLARHWGRALERQNRQLPSLKTIFFAGEPLSSELVARWRRHAPAAEMVNLYGPSETTLARFYYRLPKDLPHTDNLPVGRPIADSAAVILGQDSLPLPDGETGTVFIDTRYATFGTVERGWRDSALASPHAVHGPCFYPTGDLGRIANGVLEILGRTDGQSKIAGIRFHPAEISAAISALAGIAEAFAFVVEASAKTVHAIYVAEAGMPALPPERIRRALAERLHPSLIPSRIVAVEALPVTQNGKLDKAAAMRLAMHETTMEERHVGQYDNDVLAVFTRTFGGVEIGTEDNFYELGGDSILAAQIAAELTVRTRRNVGPADVLAHARVGELAEALTHLEMVSDAPEERIDAAPRNEAACIELSPRQLAYRAVCMAEGDRDWCILSRVIAQVGAVEPDVLRAAIRSLAQCHDVLRLQFPNGAVSDTQHIVCAEADFAQSMSVEMHDFSALADDAFEQKLSELRAEGSRRLFDLTRAPLLRCAIVQGRKDRRLVLWTHHLIMDGPSLNMFSHALQAVLNGSGHALPLPTAGYRDFIAWQHRRSRSSQQVERAYWLSLLENFRPVRVNERRLPGRDPQGYIFTRPFAPGVVQAVRARAVEWQCTPFTILLAGFIQAIGTRSGNAAPAIIVPMQARGLPCFAETMGLFFSMGIVRLALDTIGRDGRFAARLQGQLNDAAAYSEYEFHQRMGDLPAADDPYFFPLSTALFNQNKLPPGMPYAAATPMGSHPLGRSLRFQIQGEVQLKGDDFLITYLHRETTFADEGGIELFADLVETKIMELVA